MLREALGVPFTATYMKGRGNYLCLHRFEAWRDSGAIRSFDETQSIRMIDDWSRDTETGDRAELEDLPEDSPFWNDISASAENCIGAECPRYDDCFVTRMRQRAADSDVVIVNHHLLCADAAVRQSAYGEVIPFCERRGHRRGASARGRRHPVLRPRRQQLPRRLADPRSRPRRRLRPDAGPREGGRSAGRYRARPRPRPHDVLDACRCCASRPGAPPATTRASASARRTRRGWQTRDWRSPARSKRWKPTSR